MFKHLLETLEAFIARNLFQSHGLLRTEEQVKLKNKTPHE